MRLGFPRQCQTVDSHEQVLMVTAAVTYRPIRNVNTAVHVAHASLVNLPLRGSDKSFCFEGGSE